MRLALCCLCFSLSITAKPLDFQVNARAAILMNADTGAVLYEKHADVPAYPASTTKIATALYVLDRGLDLNRRVTVSADCLRGRPLHSKEHPYWLDTDGVTMGLKRGEIVSLEALIHGMMLTSGNDAANVIAESIGGTVPKFIDLLNEYLQGIGCKNTQFRNPHGLHHLEHWSTPYDLALMTKKALQISKFRKIVTTLKYKKPKTNKQSPHEIRMCNRLVKPNSAHYYSKAIGVKTGYHSAGKFCLVAAAEHEGRTLIAVVLGCEKNADRFEEAKRLFEAAFAEEKMTRQLIGPENSFRKEVVGAKNGLNAGVNKPISIAYFPSEEPKCKAALHWNDTSLPIRKGQKVGEVQIYDENQVLLKKEDLVALEEVKGGFLFTLKKKLLKAFVSSN
jgi:D-alanyl-D-alanine carboxypeptidase (penicillin-binding protein 5/6)